MTDDKVRAARQKADVLTPRSGWASLSDATFSIETRERLAAIAHKAGAQPEAIGRLLRAAQFAVIRAHISSDAEAPATANTKIRNFLAAARELSGAWRDLGPVLASAIIEHAKPMALSRDLDEVSAAISGAAYVEHILGGSGAHRPKEYALCDALCEAWVGAGLHPGFTRGTTIEGQKKELLFEQFAIEAAKTVGAAIGPGIFSETIRRHKGRLPSGVKNQG